MFTETNETHYSERLIEEAEHLNQIGIAFVEDEIVDGKVENKANFDAKST